MVPGSIPGGHWIFHWHIFFRPYHGPGVDSVPSQNEYQEHSWGLGGRCVRLTTSPCRMSWKSGSLNLLEPSGPHQACNGMTLPFTSLTYVANACKSVGHGRASPLSGDIQMPASEHNPNSIRSCNWCQKCLCNFFKWQYSLVSVTLLWQQTESEKNTLLTSH